MPVVDKPPNRLIFVWFHSASKCKCIYIYYCIRKYMLQHIRAMLLARKDKKNLQKRIETLDKAFEQHLLDHDELNFKALDLLERLENKMSGRKGGRPKKEESETDINKNIMLNPDGNPI